MLLVRVVDDVPKYYAQSIGSHYLILVCWGQSQAGDETTDIH